MQLRPVAGSHDRPAIVPAEAVRVNESLDFGDAEAWDDRPSDGYSAVPCAPRRGIGSCFYIIWRTKPNCLTPLDLHQNGTGTAPPSPARRGCVLEAVSVSLVHDVCTRPQSRSHGALCCVEPAPPGPARRRAPGLGPGAAALPRRRAGRGRAGGRGHAARGPRIQVLMQKFREFGMHFAR